MNYTRQYQNKINWQNEPSISTPINETNLGKMDNALFYMDNALYILSKAIGGGSSIRGGIIDNVGNNMFRTYIYQRTGEALAADELLLLRSEVNGTGTGVNVYTDVYSAQGVELLDLDGESTSVTLTDESIMFLLMVDQASAKVLAVIDADSSGLSGLGIGKMTSYSDNVVDTDIDLYKAPEIGDRILLYCNNAVSNPSKLKTYNNGTAVLSNVDMVSPLNYVKGWNILEYKNQIGNRWHLVQSIATLPYTAGIGISINDATIINNNPQLGTNCAYEKFDSSISGGNLGTINGYSKYLMFDFRVDATADEDDGYTFVLQSGTTTIINKYAVLKDRNGNLFKQPIYAGMLIKCESNVSGSGTVADPVVVTVLSIDNWYVQRGCATGTEAGYCATVEGQANEGTGERAHVEGYQNEASGSSSHAQGWGNTAEGDNSHAEGQGNTASGTASHAENYGNTASGHYSHAQGYQSTASGNSASASGISTTASGDAAFTSGSYNTASGSNSTATGDGTRASGAAAFSGGEGTVAGYANQTALGQYNSNKSGNLLEVGNGSDDDDRSNALEVTADGNVLDGHGNDLASVAALETSASGNPIIINAQPVDAKELSVEIEPIQDLHGYDSPWAGGSGKNKLPLTLANLKSLNTGGIWSGNTYTLNNVTFDVQTDDGGNVTGIKGNGTANATTTFVISPFMDLSAFNGMLINGNTAAVDDAIIRTEMEASPWTGYSQSGGTDATIGTYAAGTNGRTFIRVFSGKTLTNQMFYPMIRNSSESATFAPYTNICPISGRTGCSVKAEGKNLLDITYNTVTQDGLTITKLGNGEYDVHGTASANGGVYLKSDMSLKLAQNAAFVGLPSNANLILSAYMNDGYLRVQGTTVKDVGGAGKTVTSIYLWYTNGINYNHVRVKPMLSYDTSISYDNFVPYVTPSQATLSFGTTVYGGQVDFNTGKVRVTKTLTTFTGASGEDWENMITGTNFHQFATSIGTAKNMLEPISNRFKLMDISARGSQTGIVSYSDKTLRVCFKDDEILISSPSAFKTWLASNNLQVCYELATPITIQLTPSMLELLKGYNYITGDGEMSVVYIPESVLPTAPTTDGTYRLICTVSNGNPVFSWVAN